MSLKSSLQNCDQVEMIYYNRNDTLIYKAKEQIEIDVLTDLISGEREIVGDTCKPSGKLNYKNLNKVLLSAEFSTSESNKLSKCNFISYHLNGEGFQHRLTYKAGMFIDDIYWNKLKWSSISSHGNIRLYNDAIK